MADSVFITHTLLLLLLTIKFCPEADAKWNAPILNADDDDDLEDDDNLRSTDNLDDNYIEKIQCYQCYNEGCNNPTYCNDAVACWELVHRQANGEERRSKDCIGKIDHIQMNCHHPPLSKFPPGEIFQMRCCKSDLCNNGSLALLETLQKGEVGENYVLKLTLAIVGPLLGLAVIIGMVYFCVTTRKTRRKRPLGMKTNKLLMDSEIFPSSRTSTTNNYPAELRATAAGDSTLKEYLDGRSLTSGSGSGLPLLVQRTLAKQVALVERLGSCSVSGFGNEVWRGVWHGEYVAVKIYFSRDETAWARETEVYSQLLPSIHDNILGYVGSDMTSRASCTQLWLVTQYHPLGSLYDYLNRSTHSLTHHQTLNICLGLVNGLLYLHTEIHGTKGKPSIAHRNLKSKNILIKTNGSCVITDFSLAITEDKLNIDYIDLKLGNKRYMSPELLDQTLNIDCLESFRSSDIYSLGLILWEVSRRCISNGVSLDYAAPYSEWLSNNTQEPSIEEMKKLVALDHRRPFIPNRWHSDATLSGLGKLMKECWHDNPAARLPILRIKKTLSKLATSDSRIHLSID